MYFFIYPPIQLPWWETIKELGYANIIIKIQMVINLDRLIRMWPASPLNSLLTRQGLINVAIYRFGKFDFVATKVIELVLNMS